MLFFFTMGTTGLAHSDQLTLEMMSHSSIFFNSVSTLGFSEYGTYQTLENFGVAFLSRDNFAHMSTSVHNFSQKTLEYLLRMSFNLCEGSVGKGLLTESSNRV